MVTVADRSDAAAATGARPVPVVETGLVHAHGLAALGAVILVALFGMIAATQLVAPDMMSRLPWMSWGRVRYAHTQGLLFGWLGNAFLAFLYHAVPILTGRPVTSRTLGRWLFGAWNFLVLVPGWLLVLGGHSQPLEWAEFPLVIDAFVMVALVLAAVQFLPPFFARGPEDLYVSSWYVIGGLVFTLFAYPMGNVVPEVRRRRQRRGVQRPVDPRRHRPVRDAAGAGGHLLRDPGLHRAADLQPLPVDARVLAAVLPLPAQRHPPLRLLGDPDGGAGHRDCRLGAARRRRGDRRRQPAAVGARRRLDAARARAALRAHRHRLLPGRQPPGRACRRRWPSTRRSTSPTGWSATRTWRCSGSPASRRWAGWSTPGSASRGRATTAARSRSPTGWWWSACW